MKQYLCIDAGTTIIKAGLVDETGNLTAMVRRTLSTERPQPGFCEMDMEELWDTVCQVLLELRQMWGPQWSQIAAIGVSGQGEGAWLLDESLRPVRNAILWNDTRSDTIGSQLWSLAGNFCREHHLTPLCKGSCLAILHWMKRNEPDHYHQIRHILYCKDWINFKLTGSIQTDYTDASTTAFHIFEKAYQWELFDLLQLEEMKQAMPTPYPSGQRVAVTGVETEEKLGIPLGTPVAAGALDVAATAVGLGVSRPGEKGSILGTSLANLLVLSEEQAKARSFTGGSVLCHAAPKTYLRQMSSLSGTQVLEWCRKEMADGRSFEEMEAMARSVPAGSQGVVFLPYLFGERAPFQSSTICAGFHGLRAIHEKRHLIRAVYESLAYVLLDCCRHMPSGSGVRQMAGGASRSDFLCSVISDVTGEVICRTRQQELGLTGLYRILSGAAPAASCETESFTPDAANHAVYTRQFEVFKDLQRRFMKLG